MARPTSQTIFHSFLYGGASALLALDLFFLAKAILQQNFVPVVPIVAGIFLAAGLLLVVFAEQRARINDKKEHRRLSRVANQLENPLRTLHEDLHSLVRSADKLPAEERMKIKRMETKSHILLENIRDVFLMLRAQDAPIAQEKRTYDACVIIKDAIDHIRPMASAQNVEITHKMHCQHAPVKVDKRLLMIALMHILENAVIYTLKPGIVNVAIIKGKNAVRIVVQDRGIGVNEQDRDAIFLPFARGDKADRFDPDGIGVGLTLSRLIVEECDGQMRWRPREHAAGTEFEIKLPLAKT